MQDIPFSAEMGPFMIETKIYAHKNVHDSRKKFMRPSKEDVRFQMSRAFFELIQNDDIMGHAPSTVEDWKIAEKNFVREFQSLLTNQKLDDENDYDRLFIG